MHADPDQAPLLPELPLGVGAAFLAMAGGCLFSPSEDRTFLVSFCAVVGLLLIAVSIVLVQNQPAVPLPDEVRTGGHGPS
jgi:hypothetical protein